MFNLSTIVAVAVAGAAGAVTRFSVFHFMNLWLGKNYPWGSLTVNLLGSFAIGCLFGFWSIGASAPSTTFRIAIMIGFLGAFTTMSAFSIDSWLLLQRGEWLKATSYMGLTFLGSLAAVSLGIYFTRNLSN